MAWTYFTNWLASGEIISQNQRNELYDAVRERIEATFATVSTANFDGIQASDLETDQITYTYAGTARTEPLHEALTRICGDNTAAIQRPNYLRNSTTTAHQFSTTPTDSTSLISIAAADRGFTASEAIAILESDINSPERWNLIRRMVQLLAYMRFYLVNAGTQTGWGQDGGTADHPTWADAKAEFATLDIRQYFESGEDTKASSIGSSLRSGSYEIEAGVMRTGSYSFPGIDPFKNGFDLWLVASNTSTAYGTNTSDSLPKKSTPWEFEIGGVTVQKDLADSFGSGGRIDFIGVAPTSGTTGYEWRSEVLCVFDDTYLDDMEPTLDPSSYWSSAQLSASYFFAIPTFTHP